MTYRDIAKEDGVCVATARSYASKKYPPSFRLRVTKKNTRNHRINPDDWERFKNKHRR